MHSNLLGNIRFILILIFSGAVIATGQEPESTHQTIDDSISTTNALNSPPEKLSVIENKDRSSTLSSATDVRGFHNLNLESQAARPTVVAPGISAELNRIEPGENHKLTTNGKVLGHWNSATRIPSTFPGSPIMTTSYQPIVTFRPITFSYGMPSMSSIQCLPAPKRILRKPRFLRRLK